MGAYAGDLADVVVAKIKTLVFLKASNYYFMDNILSARYQYRQETNAK